MVLFSSVMVKYNFLHAFGADVYQGLVDTARGEFELMMERNDGEFELMMEIDGGELTFCGCFESRLPWNMDGWN